MNNTKSGKSTDPSTSIALPLLAAYFELIRTSLNDESFFLPTLCSLMFNMLNNIA